MFRPWRSPSQRSSSSQLTTRCCGDLFRVDAEPSKGGGGRAAAAVPGSAALPAEAVSAVLDGMEMALPHVSQEARAVLLNAVTALAERSPSKVWAVSDLLDADLAAWHGRPCSIWLCVVPCHSEGAGCSGEH